MANRVRHPRRDGAGPIDPLEEIDQIASFRFRHADGQKWRARMNPVRFFHWIAPVSLFPSASS